MLTYEIRRELRQNLGSAAEDVFDVFVHHADNGVVEIPHERVAAEAAVSTRTARRAIDKLCAGGWIKREHRFHENRQRVNAYAIPTFLRDHPPGQNDHPNIDTTSSPTTRSSLIPEEEEDLDSSFTSGPLRGPSVNQATDEELLSPPAVSQMEGGWYRTPRGTEMPLRGAVPFGYLNPFSLHSESSWLIMFFEGFVLGEINRERLQLGKTAMNEIKDLRRLDGWFTSARTFLSQPNPPALNEMCDVIRHVFNEWSGVLPFQVFNEFSPTAKCRPKDRKITRLKQIFDNWGEIRAHMLVATPIQEVEVNYGPRVNQAQLDELVRLYVEFRRKPWEPSEFDLNGWRKTFRIMLGHDRRDFDAVKMVLVNLRSLDRWIDVDRYADHAIRLREEYDYVQEQVVDLLFRLPSPTEIVNNEPQPATPEEMRAAGFAEEEIESVMRRRRNTEQRQRQYDDGDFDHVTTEDILARM